MGKKRKNPKTGEVVELVDGRWVPYIDRERGAPFRVRMAVGDEGRPPEDRLATLQNFYPDARRGPKGELLFTDPQTGMTTAYNPPGFDVGDLGEYGRVLPEMVGGIVGATAGMLAPPGSQAVTVPAGAGLLGEAAGGFYDYAMNQFGGRVDRRTVPHRAADTVAGVTSNALGQQIGDAGNMAARAALGGIKNRMAGATGAEVIADMDVLKVPVDGAISAGSPTAAVQAGIHSLAVLPTSAGTVRRATDATVDGLDAAAQRIGGQYGRARTAEEAGGSILKGLDKFKVAQIGGGGKADKLYGAFGRYVKPDDAVRMDATTAMLKEPVEVLKRHPHIASEAMPPKFIGFLEDITESGGEMTWKELKEFRSMIGHRIGQPSWMPSEIPVAQWKRLYGALSQDMRGLAQAKGPEALKAFERANHFWEKSMARMEVFEKIAKAPETEKALNAALSGSKQGGSLLRKLRAALPKEQYNNFSAYVVYRMSRANPGAQNAAGDAFSVNSLVTNWNKLPERSRNALFGNNPRLYKDLKRLVRATAGMKDAEKLRNTSNTASQNFYLALMTGGPAAWGLATGSAGGAATAGAFTFGVPWAMSKLMTKPSFVRWLARGATEMTKGGQSAAGHMSRLVAISEAEPEIKSEINLLLDAFREAPLPNPTVDRQIDEDTQKADAE